MCSIPMTFQQICIDKYYYLANIMDLFVNLYYLQKKFIHSHIFIVESWKLLFTIAFWACYLLLFSKCRVSSFE